MLTQLPCVFVCACEFMRVKTGRPGQDAMAHYWWGNYYCAIFSLQIHALSLPPPRSFYLFAQILLQALCVLQALQCGCQDVNQSQKAALGGEIQSGTCQMRCQEDQVDLSQIAHLGNLATQQQATNSEVSEEMNEKSSIHRHTSTRVPQNRTLNDNLTAALARGFLDVLTAS